MPTRDEIRSYFDAAGKRPQVGQMAALIDSIPMVDGAAGEIEYWDESAMQFKKSQFGGRAVRLHTEVITPADVLTGGTTDVVLNIPRQAGQSIGIIGTPTFSMVFGSTSYATNTVVELAYDGADVPLFTCDILGRTASGAKQGVPVTTVGDAQSQVVQDADLVWRVQGGDPDSGDGISTVSVAYIKI